MAIVLDENKKAYAFKELATRTFYDVGIELGLDKHYTKPTTIKAVIYKAYKEVRQNPEKFLISPDTVGLVVKAVESRTIAPKKAPTLAEQKESKALAESDIKTLIMSNRDTANKLIHKKLEQLDKSKKALKNESLVSLGKIFGILFDKGQIIQGQATEHVALMGKIDNNLSPSEAIDLVLKMREITTNDKSA